MTDHRNPTVTIDDLLKLKRAESPPPEFWVQFERELRAKQLAAIVEKRPWWCAIPVLYVFVVRRRLSLAAGASALAIGMVSFNAYETFRASAALESSDLQVASVALPAASLPAVAAESPAASAHSPAPVAVASVASIPRSARPAARSAVATAENVPVIPLLDDMPPSAATERFDALSRSLGGDLTAGGVAIPTGARGLLVGSRDFGARVISARVPVAEPLAQMQAPAEHRSRLLAEIFPATGGTGELIAPPSERILRSLSDERLYSSQERYDLATERDSIKISIKF